MGNFESHILKNKEIIFSLPDIAHAIKKYRFYIFLCSLICGTLFFLYLIGRPIQFTAEGVFQGGTAQISNSLFKTLQYLDAEKRQSSYYYAEEPRAFLNSYPVLEQVVKTLNLQAKLTEKKFAHRVRCAWQNFKVSKSLCRLSKENPPSHILNNEIYAPYNLLLPDITSELVCNSVEFLTETSCTLKIQFINEACYRVLQNNKEIGKGEINSPFTWYRGCFSLSGKAKKGKTYYLHFIPLDQAVRGLKKGIYMTKDKVNPSLLHIKYTHSDRQLAAQIVNQVMVQYEVYLKKEGIKKVNTQLAYLHQREEEILNKLEQVMHRHQEYLESNLDSSAIVKLDKEVEYMAQKQAEKREMLIEIRSELEHLLKQVEDPELKDFKTYGQRHLALKNRDCGLSIVRPFLSIDSVRSLIQQRQQELDLFCLENARYEYCLNKLAEADFDCASLSKILEESSLSDRLYKIHSIHRQLVDQSNWTSKEREHLKEELETEKMFILRHIRHLKEGVHIQENILKEKISDLQKSLVVLLSERYEQLEESLNLMKHQAAHFPEKWLSEEKIELNANLAREMMEAIAKMIEAKNIEFNIDSVSSSPLQLAIPPVIPNNPRLFSLTLLGFTTGGFAAIMVVCFYLVWLGPSGSFDNLTSQGRQVLKSEKDIPRLGLSLANKGAVVVLASTHVNSIFIALSYWLSKKGEAIFVIDLTKIDAISAYRFYGEPLNEEHAYAVQLLLSKYTHAGSAYIASSLFRNFINQLKETYDRILILSESKPKEYELEALLACADSVVYGPAGESLVQLSELPHDTIFYFQEPLPSQVHKFDQLTPLLDRLINMKGSFFSFSSVKGALQRYLSRKI